MKIKEIVVSILYLPVMAFGLAMYGFLTLLAYACGDVGDDGLSVKETDKELEEIWERNRHSYC